MNNEHLDRLALAYDTFIDFPVILFDGNFAVGTSFAAFHETRLAVE